MDLPRRDRRLWRRADDLARAIDGPADADQLVGDSRASGRRRRRRRDAGCARSTPRWSRARGRPPRAGPEAARRYIVARSTSRYSCSSVLSALGVFYIATFIDLADKLFRGSATTVMMLRFFYFQTPQFPVLHHSDRRRSSRRS